MSSKSLLYLCLILSILLSGIVAPLFKPTGVVAAPPNAPTNVSPSNGATVSLTPTLQSSPFLDSDNDTHFASWWQVTLTAGGYSSPVWDSGVDTSKLTSIVVPAATLAYSTTYYWHVRYQDNQGYWSSYSNDTSFTTVGSPTVPPTAVTNDATSLGTTLATVNGNLTSLGTASSVMVSFEWGLTTSYGYLTTPQAKTAMGTFSASLTGLTPSATYHFRAIAVGDGTSVGVDKSFTTNATSAPVVSTNAASSVATTSATLNGNLTSLGTASSVMVSFEWGLTISYGNVTTAEAKSAIGTFTANLTGLTVKTTYHFKAIAVGDGTTPGDDLNFTTSAIEPSVTTNAASSVATTSATLNGNLIALGTASSVMVSFEWGLTTSYGNTTTPQAKSAIGTLSASLTGLTADTTYHFRAIAVGDGTMPGDDLNFTTLTIEPLVTTGAATNLATTSATLNGNLTSLGAADNVTVYFEWGLTISYGNVTTAEAKSAIGTFTANLTGLTAKTTYHFRAIAVGDGTTPGDDLNFTTSAIKPSVITNAASSVATTSATLNGNLASKGTVDNVTVYFEWGLTISYGNTTTPQAKTAIGTLSASLTGLTADTTYHFRAVAVGDGSVVYGDDVTLTTASQADTTAPVISAVNSSDITVSGATITWTTDETATTQVEYGLTTAYGWTETAGSNAVKNHRVDLPDLEASKTYHYRVISKDAANNQAVSADATFTTTTATPPSGGGIPPWARPIIVFAVVGGAVAAYFISTRLAKK